MKKSTNQAPKEFLYYINTGATGETCRSHIAVKKKRGNKK
jgi:hypothetical protein